MFGLFLSIDLIYRELGVGDGCHEVVLSVGSCEY